jgi:leader peptidase (prepilin peptidase)/N-methyltransferase
VACYLVFGLNAEALKWAIFGALMIVLTITDLRERILPDKVNFLGLGLGLLLSFFTRPVDGTALWLANHWFAFPPPEAALSFADALIGAGAASGLLWLVAEGYFRARGREGMGLGDVKMMAMAGAFLGLQRALLTILLGSLLGSIIGVAVIAIGRKGRDFELPFGTFLGAGAMLVVFFGSAALDWYRAFAHV